MEIERRRHPRFCEEMPVVAELPDGHCLVGTTCDLSHQGARLRLNQRLPSGVRLMVAINPEGAAADCKERYTLWANVLHSGKESQPCFELGIQYARPPDHYLQLIARLAAPQTQTETT